MDVDISKLSYLSDSVDFKTIESIESCIGSTWEMTLDNPLQEVLDCKIISARWVSDQSAIDVLKCEPNDLSDYKILEVKYSVWMTTHVASYEIINRITNIEYPYVNEYDDLTDPKSYYIIHDIEIESIEGNIEHTKLPEEGILKLLDSLEYGKLSGDLPYIEPEELPDNLHPRIRELHNRLYAITLKEQHEQDKKEAEIESERNRMTLEFSNQTSQCSNTVFLSTLTSKLGTHYFEIKLSYEEDDDFCSLLEIAAHTPMKWSSRKLLPVWMKYIYISPIKINEANQYLKDWVGNPENLELLRTLHFQSRIDDKKK